MTLSVDDEVTIAEVVVILVGIAVTWAVYHRSGAASASPVPRPGSSREPGPEPADNERRRVE
jgi:hypothetical protein